MVGIFAWTSHLLLRDFNSMIFWRNNKNGMRVQLYVSQVFAGPKKGRSSTTNLAKVIEMGWTSRALKLMVRNILTKLLEVKGIGLDYVAW